MKQQNKPTVSVEAMNALMNATKASAEAKATAKAPATATPVNNALDIMSFMQQQTLVASVKEWNPLKERREYIETNNLDIFAGYVARQLGEYNYGFSYSTKAVSNSINAKRVANAVELQELVDTNNIPLLAVAIVIAKGATPTFLKNGVHVPNAGRPCFKRRLKNEDLASQLHSKNATNIGSVSVGNILKMLHSNESYAFDSVGLLKHGEELQMVYTIRDLANKIAIVNSIPVTAKDGTYVITINPEFKLWAEDAFVVLFANGQKATLSLEESKLSVITPNFEGNFELPIA